MLRAMVIIISVGSLASAHSFTTLEERDNPNATFTWIFKNVISTASTAACIECHKPPKPAGRNDYSSYDKVMASRTIIKENPEGSSFYTQMTTEKMPPKGPPVGNVSHQAVYDWIKKGAPND